MVKNRKAFAFFVIALMTVGVASPFMFAQDVQAAQYAQISPTFRTVLMCRVGNTLRIAWSDLIAQNMKDIGIQVERQTVTSDIFYARALQAPVATRGNIYDLGGFDIVCSGWAFGPDPQSNIFGLYHSSQFPPEGSNYPLWNNTANDALCEQIISELNQTTSAGLIRDWQLLAYDELPVVTLHYTVNIFPMSLNFNATQVLDNDYPRWPGVEHWKYDSSPRTDVTMVQPSDGYISLSPFHTNWLYDLAIYGPIYGECASYGMYIRMPDMSMAPYMATGYTVDVTGLHWIFNFTHGIKFQNGEELDARDLVWTLRYQMTPAFGAFTRSYIMTILGANDSVYWPGEAGTAGAAFKPDMYAVCFDVPTTWATFLADIGGATIFPASVLTNSSSGIPELGTWTPNVSDMQRFAYTSFCTGQLTDTYKYYAKNTTQYTTSGPIGAGPYKWGGWNPSTGICTLYKNTGYFRRAALEAKGEFTIDTYYVKGITGGGGPTAALAELSAGNAQLLESNYNWGSLIGSLNPAWSKYVVSPSYGVQELGFNMRHPVWGIGTATPNGFANASNAADAAKHCRKAVEALCPKDGIIASLLGGFGAFGVTTPVQTRTFGYYGDSMTLRRYPNYNDARDAAIREFQLAGYTFTYPPPPSFWETYGLLLSVVELAVIVVLAGFYFFRPRKM